MTRMQRIVGSDENRDVDVHGTYLSTERSILVIVTDDTQSRAIHSMSGVISRQQVTVDPSDK